MKVLLIGARGMLGKDIADTFTAAGHMVLVTDRQKLDMTDETAVQTFVASEKPDVIINAAAYNFVDKVEDADIYPVARAVNALGPQYLARAAKVADIPFVHFSTDYVFAGNKVESYIETDPTDPISRYGETKAEGERLVLAEGGRAYVLRTSKLFGLPGLSEESKQSFVAVMLRLAAEKPELSVIDDEIGCPTYTPHLAQATLRLVENVLSPEAHTYEPGVYHFVNEGPGVTWFAFAKEIFEAAQLQPVVKPISADAYPRPARRPHSVILKNTKFPPLPPRQQALQEFVAVLASQQKSE